MKRNKLIAAVLTTSLMLSGCAASEKNKDKKADEKISQKERSKSKSKKKESKKNTKETNEAKEETSQEQETQASQVEETPVATGISSMYTDEELLTYANDHLDDFCVLTIALWQVHFLRVLEILAIR